MSFFGALFGLLSDIVTSEPDLSEQEGRPDEKPSLTRAFGPGRPCRTPPPSTPGLYRWISRKTGVSAYIGQTCNLRRRKADYERDGIFTSARYIFEWQEARPGTTCAQLKSHEKRKIKQKKPSKNRNGGGGGRNWVTRPLEDK